MIKYKTCQICGISFSNKVKNGKFLCNSEFDKRRFCSHKCSGINQSYAKKSTTFKKGHIVSKEVRNKISIAHKGRKHSEEHSKKIRKWQLENLGEKHPGWKGGKIQRNCIICNNIFKIYPLDPQTTCSIKCGVKYRASKMKGENHPNWKGGVTPENRRIRSSIEYKKWRTMIFERDNYTCVWCGIRGGKLNADHIKPFAHFPELRFDMDNGRTLCVPCHKKTPTYLYRTRWKLYE